MAAGGATRVEITCPCGRARPLQAGAAAIPPCDGCGRGAGVAVPEALRQRGILDRCLACGERQIYRQRDFDRRVGVAIVAAGAALSLALLPVSVPLAYGVLFGMAILDAVLYLLLPEVAICYRCKARHRGWARESALQPFDLLTAELIDQQVRDSGQGRKGAG